MKQVTYGRWAVMALTSIVAVSLTFSLAGCGSVDEMGPAAAATSSSPTGTLADPSVEAPSPTTPGSAEAKSTSQRKNGDPKARKARARTVPAPSSGNIRKKVKRHKHGAVQQVDLGEEAALPEGVRIKVLKVKSFTAKAETPGEITGSALAIAVRLKNSSMDAINVDSAMVSLTESNGDPAQPTTSDPYSPFSGEIRAGDQQTATYVFLIPKKHRKDLSITVEYLAGQSIVDFSSNAS